MYISYYSLLKFTLQLLCPEEKQPAHRDQQGEPKFWLPSAVVSQPFHVSILAFWNMLSKMEMHPLRYPVIGNMSVKTDKEQDRSNAASGVRPEWD